MKKSLYAIPIVILVALLAGNETRIPDNWHKVELGMTREQVLGLIGEPTYDLRDLKGAFWRRNRFITTNEFHVYFDRDQATIVSLERRIGSNRHFFRQQLRFDVREQSNLPIPITNSEPECADKGMEFVWNNMNRKQFVKLKTEFLVRTFSEIEVRERFLTEWGLRDLKCSYFAGASSIDLNQDGVLEYIVTGRVEMRNAEELIYTQTESGLKLILIDGYNIEKKIETQRRHGFPDITYLSNWSGGQREVKTYKFDGRAYFESECFWENHFVSRNGETILVDKPVRTRMKCSQRFGTP